MAILTRGRVITPTRATALVMVVMAAGCMLGKKEKRRFAFSHAMHVAEQGLECINCHADVGRSETPGMPAPDACAVCHEEIDAEKPVEKHVSQLFEGDTYRAMHAARLEDEVVFSHVRHATALADCGLCHAGIETNTAVDPGMQLSMDDCTDCHATRNVPAECGTCHTTVRADVAPPSHGRNWQRTHGGCARWPSEATADRCSLCHQDSSCIQCHREEAPENHNVFWRMRGHGITSMIDRENCAACHDPVSCDRCHSDALPQSHVAGWGAPRDTHCFGCHFPLREEGCVACHSRAYSHDSAPPKPDDPFHVRGQNCRQCHGLSAPLVHVDNGDDCNACHH